MGYIRSIQALLCRHQAGRTRAAGGLSPVGVGWLLPPRPHLWFPYPVARPQYASKKRLWEWLHPGPFRDLGVWRRGSARRENPPSLAPDCQSALSRRLPPFDDRCSRPKAGHQQAAAPEGLVHRTLLTFKDKERLRRVSNVYIGRLERPLSGLLLHSDHTQGRRRPVSVSTLETLG